MLLVEKNYAEETADHVLAHIVDLMQRYHAAERSDSEDEEAVHVEISETPFGVHIPEGDCDPDTPKPITLTLTGGNSPTVRATVAETGKTELLYAYWSVPWTPLPVPTEQQRYLDGFGAEFLWMREEFG